MCKKQESGMWRPCQIEVEFTWETEVVFDFVEAESKGTWIPFEKVKKIWGTSGNE